MSTKQVLGSADYAVILIFLAISASIGIGIKLIGDKQNTTVEYFLANKQAPMTLVISSTTATILSAVAMLGTSAETYRFGIVISVQCLGVFIGMCLASIIFLPVYFQLKVGSIYEFLEMRFGRITRYATSAVFIVQMILYSSTVLFAPVLALSAVTNIPLEMGIIVCGAVCTFYCLVGGLKAVLWADLFQIKLMTVCLIIVFAVGIAEVGGILEVFRRATIGNRMQYFEMQFDFTTRYDFWNMLFRGLFFGIYYYGATQVEVQRSLSMSNCKRAQRALQWSSVTFALLFGLTCYTGILLYAVFYLCDPLLRGRETGLTKYDQLLPYFIITRLKSFPGLTGLCIAGIFSGSLSSLSSAINSISTVAVIDFVQPSFGIKLNQATLVLIAKVLSLVSGMLIIGVSFTLSNVDSIFRVCMAFLSIVEGPCLALFMIGVLTRKVSDKSATIGLLIGMAFISWIGIGSTFSGYSSPSLPLEAINCPGLWNATDISPPNSTKPCSIIHNCTSPISLEESRTVFFLYKISVAWVSSIGCVITIATIFTASFLIDSNKDVIPSNSLCLSPVVYRWMHNTSEKKQSESQEIKVVNQECDKKNISSAFSK